MTVQAGYGALVALQQPEQARDSLTAIAATGRETLAELRRILQVLRAGDDLELAPVPGLAGLDRLVGGARTTGVDIRLDLDGSLGDLPSGVDLAAYRVVQEALTNTLRHSRAGRIALRLHRSPQALVIEVTDDGTGVARFEPGQMRDRVHLYGGTLRAGPLPTGGFGVRAEIPLAAEPVR